jgi:hypothetical protein
MARISGMARPTVYAGVREAEALTAQGHPVSVDTKKKEQVGADRRHEWHGEWNYSLLPQAA